MSIPKETLLHAYRTMKTIREFEERVNAEIMNGQIPGFTHLYTGQEANAVGVCAHLDESDTIISTHRGHGHCIAKGAEVSGMMKELSVLPKAARARAAQCTSQISTKAFWAPTASLRAAPYFSRFCSSGQDPQKRQSCRVIFR